MAFIGNKMRSSVFSLVFIVFAISAFFIVPALGVDVDRPVISLEVDTGMTYKVPITLSIPHEEPGDIYSLDVSGLGQSPFDGAYIGLDAGEDTGPYTARPFITLDNASVSIKAGEKAVVTALIAVPADALDGGRYALIEAYAASASTAAGPAVAIPVFLVVRGGNDTPLGQITGLEYTTYTTGEPSRIATYFINTGALHISSAVDNVTLYDNRGRAIAHATASPLTVIPGQEVRFEVSVPGNMTASAYRVTTRVEGADGTPIAEREEYLGEATPQPTGSSASGALAALAAVAFGLALAARGHAGKR